MQMGQKITNLKKSKFRENTAKNCKISDISQAQRVKTVKMTQVSPTFFENCVFSAKKGLLKFQVLTLKIIKTLKSGASLKMNNSKGLATNLPTYPHFINKIKRQNTMVGFGA